MFGMDGARLMLLTNSMPILEAEDELRGVVPDNRVYDVVLAATGSEEEASKALTKRIEERNRRNESADI